MHLNKFPPFKIRHAIKIVILIWLSEKVKIFLKKIDNARKNKILVLSARNLNFERKKRKNSKIRITS